MTGRQEKLENPGLPIYPGSISASAGARNRGNQRSVGTRPGVVQWESHVPVGETPGEFKATRRW
jgi:hypothetical protein